MKRELLFLILAAAVLLSGCGAGTSEPTPAPEPAPTATAVPTPAPTEDPTPTPEPTPAPPAGEELPGTVDKRVYTNRYFSLGCELEPNWTYYTRAQIEELTDMARQGMDESTSAAFDEVLGEGGAAYCMVASANKLNLNMAVQRADGTDPESALTDSAGELTAALESAGLTGAVTETGTVTFAGRSCPGLTVSGTLNGQPRCIRCTAVEAWGYIAVVSASAPSAEEAADILAHWYALETE